MRIAVIGAGYVGLVTGACLANLGHEVHIFDVEMDRVERLQRGECPIFEPGLEELMDLNGCNGYSRLAFKHTSGTCDEPDAYYIAVGTPPDDEGNADMSFVLQAADWIAKAHAGSSSRAFVVIKSTVPPGTAARVKASFPDPANVSVVSNPEFLKEGTAIKDFSDPDKVVVGSLYAEDFDKIMEIYERSGIPKSKFFMVSNSTAELAKYANNGMLATRISFMNEMSRIAHDVGASIDDIRRVIGADSRIGAEFLRAGPGWGGSCFPKDLSALSMMAGDPSKLPLVDSAIETNLLQVEYIAERILHILGPNANRKTLTLWGLAFKPGTDDTRCSPAIALLEILATRIAKIVIHDPVAIASEEILSLGNIQQAPFRDESAINSDLVVVVTDWSCYASVDWSELALQMKGLDVFDTRNIIKEPLLEHGLRLHRL